MEFPYSILLDMYVQYIWLAYSPRAKAAGSKSHHSVKKKLVRSESSRRSSDPKHRCRRRQVHTVQYVVMYMQVGHVAASIIHDGAITIDKARNTLRADLLAMMGVKGLNLPAVLSSMYVRVFTGC